MWNNFCAGSSKKSGGDLNRLAEGGMRYVFGSPITFPNLGITVDPNPVAFTVFGKDIYWYGIIIALGFLLAVIYMMRRAPVFGLTQDDVLDEVLWRCRSG